MSGMDGLERDRRMMEVLGWAGRLTAELSLAQVMGGEEGAEHVLGALNGFVRSMRKTFPDPLQYVAEAREFAARHGLTMWEAEDVEREEAEEGAGGGSL